MTTIQWNTLFRDIEFLENEPLSHYTYTKTGGRADVLVFPKTIHEVQTILSVAHQHNLPLTILGNASNLIVRDGGIRGIVMMMTQLIELSIDGTTLYATCGVPLIEASRAAANQQLTGLEFACGIPGSIGGAVYMNAGAYGGEVCDIIKSVDAVALDGTFKTIPLADCDFGYRHSRFQTSDEIVVGVRFSLAKGDATVINAKIADLTHQRETKQPLEYPSCGSVFKRPEGYFAGKLIQDAGLQGHRIGGAEVSRKHAGFIVNIDHATATDYTDLIEHIQVTVWGKTGVLMEPEVKIIGELTD